MVDQLISALAYADTGLSPSTTYSYTVTATDAAGNLSGPSTAASATTMNDRKNVGYAELTSERRRFNTAILVGPEGKIVGKYRWCEHKAITRPPPVR